MADDISVRKMRKYGPSMNVPGRGDVEIPKNMDSMGGLGNGRSVRNARHFANVMDPFCGSGDSVDYQYTGSKGG